MIQELSDGSLMGTAEELAIHNHIEWFNALREILSERFGITEDDIKNKIIETRRKRRAAERAFYKPADDRRIAKYKAEMAAATTQEEKDHLAMLIEHTEKRWAE